MNFEQARIAGLGDLPDPYADGRSELRRSSRLGHGSADGEAARRSTRLKCTSEASRGRAASEPANSSRNSSWRVSAASATKRRRCRVRTAARRTRRRASQPGALPRGEVRQPRRAARRSRASRHGRAAQGDRPLRPRARRRVHDLRDADDRRRNQALFPRQGLGGQSSAPAAGAQPRGQPRGRQAGHRAGHAARPSPSWPSTCGAGEEEILEAQELGQAYNLLSLDSEVSGENDKKSQTLADTVGVADAGPGPARRPRQPRARVRRAQRPRTRHHLPALLRVDLADRDRQTPERVADARVAPAGQGAGEAALRPAPIRRCDVVRNRRA